VTDATRYPAQVFWSDEDNGFIAVAPDLPGCSAFGDTQQEALSQLPDAIEAWIEAAQAAGNPIPEPSSPALEADYSGKVLLRMPRGLHARLAYVAKTEGVSLNHYIVYLLAAASTHRSPRVSHLVVNELVPSGQVTIWSHQGVSNVGGALFMTEAKRLVTTRKLEFYSGGELVTAVAGHRRWEVHEGTNNG